MLILQHRPSRSDILDIIDDSIRQLAEAGTEARYILMGGEAHERFRNALAERLQRDVRQFGTYNYLPVVVDPFRGDAVCVLPEPAALAGGVEVFDIPTDG